MSKRGQLGVDCIIMAITVILVAKRNQYHSQMAKPPEQKPVHTMCTYTCTCIYMHHSSCSPDEYKFPFLSGQY